MISTLIAGLSLLVFSGLANTYISYLLIGKPEELQRKNIS